MCETSIISSIKVVSFNTRGLRNVTIPSLFDRFDIVLLQETLQCKQDLGQLNSLSPFFQGTGVAVTDLSTGILKGRPSGGVAILYRKSLSNFVKDIHFDLDWIVGISLNIPNENSIYIISVYLPCNSRENEDEFLEKLGMLVSIINDLESPFVWVLGDFNAHMGPSPSEFGKYLNDVCLENDLKISSNELLKNDSFTYISERWESTSWLDHCISTEGAHERIENFKIEYDLSARDHIPISLVIPMNNEISVNLTPNLSTSECIDWDNVTPDLILEYQVKCEALLRDIEFPAQSFYCPKFNCSDEKHFIDFSQYYDSIVHAMHEASLPMVKFFKNRPKPFPGWNSLVQQAHSISINAFKQWKRAGKPKFGYEYDRKKETHRNFKYAVRRAKRDVENVQRNNLAEKLCQGRGKDFWKDIRKIQGNSNVKATSIEGVTGDLGICEVWKNHYKKSFNCIEQDEFQIGTVGSDYSAIVTSSEVHSNISSINNTYSPGPDGISAQHLKFGPPLLCKMLANCFTAFFVHGRLPSKMLDIHLVPVVKDNRGKIGSIDNYRPIAKASCISKVFELCILSRIEDKIAVSENQFGFKKGIGTDSCIFVLKEIINKFKRSNTNVFMAFLDASKAFDRVRHDLLFTKLNRVGVPLYIIRILKYWYHDQTMFAKWNTCLSQSFRCINGVKQGGILSPYLFNFYFDGLSRQLNELNIGCVLNSTINHIFYADDLVLVAPSQSGLQRLISECETFSRVHSVQFNIKKSKLMIMRAKNFTHFEFGDIKLNGANLEKVSNFKYLGHVLTESCNDHDDIMRHCRYLYAVGNSIIRKFYFCSLQVKLKLFMTYCGNIYSGHLWHNFKGPSLNKAKVAYNSILRRLLNIPRVQDGRSYSASAMFASHGIPSFSCTVRKMIFSFSLRLDKSDHSVIRYLNDHTNRIVSEWWRHTLLQIYTVYISRP